jgi:hypothetical protein
MVHTAIALPRALLESLKADAAASSDGLSTEIRRRLELVDKLRAFAEKSGHETRDLTLMAEQLAVALADDVGPQWHEHAYALAAFKAGLLALLAQYKPEGDANVRPKVGAFGEPKDPPEVVGRMHAKRIWDAMCEAREDRVPPIGQMQGGKVPE